MFTKIAADATTNEALTQGTINWTVGMEPVHLADGTRIRDRFAVQRSSDGHVYDVVSGRYSPLQNRQLIELGEACRAEAGGNDKLRIDQIGSFKNGAQIIVNLAGAGFTIRGRDEVAPYLMLATTHNRSGGILVSPMTERIWCANQLPSISQRDASFNIRHTGDMASKITAVRRALDMYATETAATEELMHHLAEKSCDADEFRKFFVDAYTEMFNPIPTADDARQDAAHARQREQAITAWRHVERTFSDELQVAGCTWWNAANSMTNWAQHRPRRGRNSNARVESGILSSVLGEDRQRSLKAFEMALTICA